MILKAYDYFLDLSIHIRNFKNIQNHIFNSDRMFHQV